MLIRMHMGWMMLDEGERPHIFPIRKTHRTRSEKAIELARRLNEVLDVFIATKTAVTAPDFDCSDEVLQKLKAVIEHFKDQEKQAEADYGKMTLIARIG